MTNQIRKVAMPLADNSGVPVALSDETMKERHQKILSRMKDKQLSSLIIYADKEHGSNFEYLVGFIPRFEEALQILNQDGSSILILGNENANKIEFARVSSTGEKCTLFSLPNQPMNDLSELDEILSKVSIDDSLSVGLVGWKLIPKMTNQFDIPSFIVEAIKRKVDHKKLVNGTDIYIGPEDGARVTNNANEIAHYEYGASLASDALLASLNALEPGMTELEAGNLLGKDGQYQTVVTIAAFGDRFIKGNLYPTNKQLVMGDKVALTVAYRGGLSSRSGYGVADLEELESVAPNYLSEVVLPYFNTYCFWLENLGIGDVGGEFYDKFNTVYPQSTYGWELCPGHLTADEEWLSSPFFEDSSARVQSGMIFQVDFIPSQTGFNGVSAESTVAIADKALREAIQKDYPELWERILKRREYMKKELGINLPEHMLPMTSTLGYYRPFFLNKEYALSQK